MLTDERIDLFRKYGVTGMGEKLREIVEDQRYDDLTFEEKVTLMIDAEVDRRRSNKVSSLVSDASFRNPSACVEEIEFLPERKLSKDRILRIARCDWVDNHGVVVVVSASGRGKSYVAQALGVAACRLRHKVLYTRLSEVFGDLDRARDEGNSEYERRMSRYSEAEVLILDDFLITPAGPQHSVDLYELIAARDGRHATIVASAVDPGEWHLQVVGPLVSNAILNRLVTESTCIDISGPNMREYLSKRRDEGSDQ